MSKTIPQTNSKVISEATIAQRMPVYEQVYNKQLQAYVDHCARTRINESVSNYELMALCMQLDSFGEYRKFCEGANKLGNLGAIPQIALDVITASQAASILPLLASTQPLSEESGIVYYRNIHAMQNAGGYRRNQIISGPLMRDVPGDGTLGSQRKHVVLTQTAAGTQQYTGNVGTHVPLRPYRFELAIQLSSGILHGKDNGQGQIVGFGFDGTIDYETGVWAIEFKRDPGETADLEAMYDIDTDATNDIDSIQAALQSKPIKAQIWALKSDIGAFSSFAFNKRFGASANQEVANDLTDEITRIMNTAAVLEIARNMLPSFVEWDVRAPAGVSYAEHKLTFIDALAAAEANLHNQSGVNGVNRMIVGSAAAAVIAGMPQFQRDVNAPSGVSVGVFGTYDNVPVIRASGVIGDDDIILVSNSGNYFNAPLAYAPFMPLMITDTVQSATNPFRGTQAAGVWAGLTSVNPAAATLLKIKRA